MIAWFVDKLLGSAADKSDPRLDIEHANLQGLPPVTIINAQIDPLHSDGVLLVEALKNAGVSVTHKEYAGEPQKFAGDEGKKIAQSFRHAHVRVSRRIGKPSHLSSEDVIWVRVRGDSGVQMAAGDTRAVLRIKEDADEIAGEPTTVFKRVAPSTGSIALFYAT